MIKTHKNQHIIPRSYLEAWSSPDTPTGHTPYVYIVSKNGETVKKRAPKNILSEQDIYTIRRKDGTRDLSIEKGLCKIEDNFARTRRDFINKKKQIPEANYFKLIMFVAALRARTKSMINYQIGFWKEIKNMADEFAEGMKMLTTEEREKLIRCRGHYPESIDYKEITELANNPTQHTFVPFVQAQVPKLYLMRCRIFCSLTSPFITSDNPVVWFDPEWDRKPPPFQSPCFSDPKLEITMPISPHQCILLTHGPSTVSYEEIPDSFVEEVNKRTRFYCDQHFVTCHKI